MGPKEDWDFIRRVSGEQHHTTGLECGVWGKVRTDVLHTGASLGTLLVGRSASSNHH